LGSGWLLGRVGAGIVRVLVRLCNGQGRRGMSELAGSYLFFGGVLVLGVTAALYRRERTTGIAKLITLFCALAICAGAWMMFGGQ